MTKLTPRQFAQGLYQAITETDPKDHDKVLDNFAEVLKQERALDMVDEIEKEFEAYDKEAKGIKTAEVTSAHKLLAEDEEKIMQQLNEYVDGDVELKKKVDEKLVGGFVVKVGDQVIDGSVKNQLKDLKNKLIK